MHDHEIVKCKLCKKIISQCRCMDTNKPVVFSICEDCKSKPELMKEKPATQEIVDNIAESIEQAVDMLEQKPEASEFVLKLLILRHLMCDPENQRIITKACDFISKGEIKANKALILENDRLEDENKQLKLADRDHLSARKGLETRVEHQAEEIKRLKEEIRIMTICRDNAIKKLKEKE